MTSAVCGTAAEEISQDLHFEVCIGVIASVTKKVDCLQGQTCEKCVIN